LRDEYAIRNTVKSNPALQVLDEVHFSMTELANYVSGEKPPSKIEFRKGIEETYIAPVQEIKDILGTKKKLKVKKKLKIKKKLKVKK